MQKKDYDLLYLKTQCKRIVVLLNKNKDADIIEHLRTKESMNAYLKDLIRKDMMKDKENE